VTSFRGASGDQETRCRCGKRRIRRKGVLRKRGGQERGPMGHQQGGWKENPKTFCARKKTVTDHRNCLLRGSVNLTRGKRGKKGVFKEGGRHRESGPSNKRDKDWLGMKCAVGRRGFARRRGRRWS